MILLAPVKTEKAIGKIEYENTLTFVVSMSATKKTVKEEMEKLFSVKVHSVKTYIGTDGKKYAVIRLGKESKADDVAVKLKMIA